MACAHVTRTSMARAIVSQTPPTRVAAIMTTTLPIATTPMAMRIRAWIIRATRARGSPMGAIIATNILSTETNRPVARPFSAASSWPTMLSLHLMSGRRCSFSMTLTASCLSHCVGRVRSRTVRFARDTTTLFPGARCTVHGRFDAAIISPFLNLL
jgi:hypothetical protein